MGPFAHQDGPQHQWGPYGARGALSTSWHGEYLPGTRAEKRAGVDARRGSRGQGQACVCAKRQGSGWAGWGEEGAEP